MKLIFARALLLARPAGTRSVGLAQWRNETPGRIAGMTRKDRYFASTGDHDAGQYKVKAIDVS